MVREKLIKKKEKRREVKKKGGLRNKQKVKTSHFCFLLAILQKWDFLLKFCTHFIYHIL